VVRLASWRFDCADDDGVMSTVLFVWSVLLCSVRGQCSEVAGCQVVGSSSAPARLRLHARVLHWIGPTSCPSRGALSATVRGGSEDLGTTDGFPPSTTPELLIAPPSPTCSYHPLSNTATPGAHILPSRALFVPFTNRLSIIDLELLSRPCMRRGPTCSSSDAFQGRKDP
jgi:hypothetical protein